MKCFACGFEDSESSPVHFRKVILLYKEPVEEKEGEPHNNASDYIWQLNSLICPECGTIKIDKK